MLVNLSDVFASEGKQVTVTAALEMDSFKTKMGDFKILDKSEVTLEFANAGQGRAKIKGHAELTFDTRCDRCLEEVPTMLTLQFDREVTSPDIALDSFQEDDDCELNYNFMEGYQINVETFVYNEILLNWPMKILCKEDCEGICNLCGKNLNEGDCGCDRFVPDPRMAAIQDIMWRE